MEMRFRSLRDAGRIRRNVRSCGSFGFYARKNRADDIEGDVANLKDMSMRYLTKAVDMFPRDESADQRGNRKAKYGRRE